MRITRVNVRSNGASIRLNASSSPPDRCALGHPELSRACFPPARIIRRNMALPAVPVLDRTMFSLLGAGGMGEVYRARDSKLNREIALKVLPEQVAADPERLARFTREAQTLAALNHPNIAHIYGLEESADVRALVMELVEGEDLAHRMRRGPIPVGEALVIGRQIAAALEAAHGRGIIHRDLKPANVMLGPGGVVKVLDFGLARRIEGPDAATAQTQEAMTQPGVLLGTPAYMAPEALVGKPADARGDIWALGVILYEMATGALPFTGPTPVEFASAILKETPAPLPQHLPFSLQTIVQRCLTKEPEQRYRGAGEVRAALDAAASGSLDGPQPHRPRVPRQTRRLGRRRAGRRPDCHARVAARQPDELDRGTYSIPCGAAAGEPVRRPRAGVLCGRDDRSIDRGPLKN